MSSTLKEIAEILGVSLSTVSRVANGKKCVNEKTRENVSSLLKKYNYTPNQAARSLKYKSSSTIGIVIPDVTENFFIDVIKGVNEVLIKNGYTMILSDTEENPEYENMYLELFLRNRIDGLILATVRDEHEFLNNNYLKSKISIVFIDNLPCINQSYDAVIIDNIKASYMATSHLISAGHKKIAIITGYQNETTGYERLIGYRKAFNDFGLKADESLIKIGSFKEDSGYSLMMELLTNRHLTGISAVYTASSKITYGAIKAIMQNKLRIPDDIAIVGFDVNDPTGLIKPSITTILQPGKNIGNIVADVLIKKINRTNRSKDTNDTEDDFTGKVMLEPHLEIKESCGFVKM